MRPSGPRRIGIALRQSDHGRVGLVAGGSGDGDVHAELRRTEHQRVGHVIAVADVGELAALQIAELLPDRKSTRLNSSHQIISYAVFCLKKKKKKNITILQVI